MSPYRYLALSIILAASSAALAADPLSDAPEDRMAARAPLAQPSSYRAALASWHSPEDMNDWIAAKFEYDMTRAMLLSETQRGESRLAIHRPEAFFATPRGVCVDLSRFAVETLRAIDPKVKAQYLMIEFAPMQLAGDTLRRHWLVSFERDGKHYFFADSKRPGHIAGPYASAREFIDEYAQYRGREIVGYRETDTYERRSRTAATQRKRQEHR